jgi:hypothetical protein
MTKVVVIVVVIIVLVLLIFILIRSDRLRSSIQVTPQSRNVQIQSSPPEIKPKSTQLSPSVTQLSEIIKKDKLNKQLKQQKLERDALASLNFLSDDFMINKNFDSIVALADIYAKGVYPIFVPNINLSTMLYSVVQAYCPYIETSRIANLKLIETETYVIDKNDIRGKSLPIEPATRILDFFKKEEEKRAKNTLKAPSRPPPAVVPPPPPPRPIPAPILPAPAPPPRWKHDAQNVHDSTVVNSFKNTIHKLLEKYPNSRGHNSRPEIREFIMNNRELKKEDRDNAIYALDWLSDDENRALENVSQNQIVEIVWKEINSKPEPLRENMKFTLSKQLASIVENGNLSCSMGRIERIAQTLEGIDDKNIVTSKPTFVLREEIAGKASKIRDEAEGLGYESNVAKEKFREEITKEYIVNLKMSPRIINPIIDEYSEGF